MSCMMCIYIEFEVVTSPIRDVEESEEMHRERKRSNDRERNDYKAEESRKNSNKLT
jgi:hypothetical protein